MQVKNNTWLAISWRLFKRELGRGELTVICLAIILAVSSVLALSSVTTRVEQAIMSKSAAFLSADNDIISAHPMPDSYLEKAKELNLGVDEHIYFNSMAFAGDEMSIVVVKAVSPSYPLRGELKVESLTEQSIVTANGPKLGELWISKRLYHTLKLNDQPVNGGNVQLDIGELTLTVAGIIDAEPDAPFQVFNSGTRVIMHVDDVAKTQVIQPGSRISYRSLFAGDSDKLAELEEWLKPQLTENQRWRTVKQGASGVSESLNKAESFLMLAGVIGVLLAAVAVSVATKLYSQRHFDAIAIFKTLGASKKQVQQVYLSQLTFITIFSVLVGLLIGLGLQTLALDVMSEHLPKDMPELGYKPVIMATLSGVICVSLFSLPSLKQLFTIPPLRVLRRTLGDVFTTSTGAKVVMALATVGLIYLYSQELKITSIVVAAAIALGVVILTVGNLMVRFGRNASQSVGSSALKIALASLKRRSKENTSQLIGFTLAIMMVLILFALENRIIKEWQEQLPVGAPNHFIINISEYELPEIKQKFADQNIEPRPFYPIIRGRLTQINDEVLLQGDKLNDGAKLTDGAEEQKQQDKKEAEEPQQRVGMGRELSLTFSMEKPDNEIIAGTWMPEGVAKQVSVEKGVAERLKIELGDTLHFLVGAKQVFAQVTSVREVNWQTLQANFIMIFSDDVLSDFPATYINSFYLPKQDKLWLNELLAEHPTVSVVDIDAMISQIQETIAQVSTSISFVLVVVVIAATLVLLSQVQSSLDERRQETVIYRTIGAKANLIQRAILLEFMALGAIAGIIAAAIAELSLLLLQTMWFDMQWQPHWSLWFIGPVSGSAFVATVGVISTKLMLKMTPSQLIRQLS